MYRRPLRSDELYHFWGIPKGGKAKNHKYIARINLGDKFRYFYDMAQLAAYNAAKAGGQVVNTVKKAADNVSEIAYNSAHRQDLKSAMNSHKRHQTEWNEMANRMSQRGVVPVYERKIANEYGHQYEDAKKRYDNSIGGKAEKVANKVKDVIGSKITGEKYKDRADSARKIAEQESETARFHYETSNADRKRLKENHGRILPETDEYLKSVIKEGDYHAKRASSARKGAESAMNDYYTKSIKGRAEKAIQNAENFVSSFFKKNKKKKVSDIGYDYYSSIDQDISFNRAQQLIKESSTGNYRDHEWMNGKRKKKRK